MSDALEYQFQDTDRRVRDLDRRLDDLESEHESLKSRFGYTDDLDHDLRTIRDDVSSCESAAEEADGRVDDLEGRVEAAERTVKRLTQHVRLLEGQIIATGKIPHADLDTFTTDQHALARTMRTGQEAADALLHDDLRYQYQAQIRRYNETRSAHQNTREEVVTLTGALLSHRHGPQPAPRPPPNCARPSRTRPPSAATSTSKAAKPAGPPPLSPQTAPQPPTSSQPLPPANVPNNA
ncbi:hypothetical protein OG471_01270 [Streptomyces sp. NBC_01336]|uniref:hypothetical protein n=1 Tax=Streptomyces sp. NBC_01336 TaxID=2903829 RepID=UPI002E140A8C|nr:hypothetical protein OG471_01270 [Streptomyces sp. NBC_01336]